MWQRSLRGNIRPFLAQGLEMRPKRTSNKNHDRNVHWLSFSIAIAAIACTPDRQTDATEASASLAPTLDQQVARTGRADSSPPHYVGHASTASGTCVYDGFIYARGIAQKIQDPSLARSVASNRARAALQNPSPSTATVSVVGAEVIAIEKKNGTTIAIARKPLEPHRRDLPECNGPRPLKLSHL